MAASYLGYSRSFVVFLLVVGSCSLAYADSDTIYTWVDAAGMTHISDRAPNIDPSKGVVREIVIPHDDRPIVATSSLFNGTFVPFSEELAMTTAATDVAKTPSAAEGIVMAPAPSVAQEQAPAVGTDVANRAEGYKERERLQKASVGSRALRHELQKRLAAHKEAGETAEQARIERTLEDLEHQILTLDRDLARVESYL